MSAFLRRFAAFPPLSTLTAIESVNVIDEAPPGQIQGVGTGTVLEVGEFEDGPFAVDGGAVEVFGGADLLQRFGGFGFTYDGTPSQNPCARSRLADSATRAEYWNGNAFVHLAGCQFARLFVARVDSSVGEVTFERLASLSGSADSTFDLEPGQTLVLSIDGAGNVTVTWDAAAATILSADGTYPYAPSGGETIVFKVDGTQYTATFQAGDTTHVAVVARLNEAAGYTAFTASSLKTRITGRIRGTSGSVQIVSGTASALTATGFSAASAVAGTGDVADIDLVTLAEVVARVEADTSSAASADRDAAGKLRIFSLTADGTGSIKAQTSSTAAGLGFSLGVTATAALGVDGVIPAGTRVLAGSQEYVTMQTVSVVAATHGPYAVKVRHALDDGTGTADIAGALDALTAPVELGAFAVTNALPTTAALTEAQLDNAHLDALAVTRAISNPVRQVNIALSARQSNAIRGALKQNAIDASDNGCFGRIALVRPPLATTTRALARGDSQPGVGGYRSDRARYAFPGVQKRVAAIAQRGTAGGAGFTADGVVDHGWDAGLACLYSRLAPEENVGQETTGVVDWVLGIEAGNADVQGLTMEDYVAFRAAGICAPRIDGGAVSLQSDVTAVSATLHPEAVESNVRRMRDFIEDTLAEAARPYCKKLSTLERRALFVAAYKGLLEQLKGDNGRLPQRIDGYLLDGKSGNTPDLLARNIFVVIVRVRMVPTMNFIALRVQVGNDVQITNA